MAGAGWRDFIPGEVLTAANVQDYLQDQAVMVFASAAARTSALASPTEGMVSYRTDANIVEVYDGSAWKQFGATTGGILQVVTAQITTPTTTSSTSFVNTAVTASITPKSTASTVLILVSSQTETPANNNLYYTLYRGTVAGTNLGQASTGMGNHGAGTQIMYATASINYLDSPATTSSQQYMFAVRVTGGTGGANTLSAKANITLIEVAA